MRRENLRWVVLILNCTLLLGNYYAYDNPSALSPRLRTHLKPITELSYETIFSLTYSVYSLPNLLLPSLTGILIQKTNKPAFILMVLSALTVIGHLGYLLGVQTLSVPLMLIGRFVFGVGGESVGVVQSYISALWFADKEIGLAMGMSLAIPRIGSVLNATLSPVFAAKFGVVPALVAGLFMCSLSFMAAVVLVFVIGIDPKAAEYQPLEEVASYGTSNEPEQVKSTVWQTLRKFPSIFWLMCVIVFCVYGTIVPFNNIVMDLMLTKFVTVSDQPVSERQAIAGSYMSIPDTICALLVLISGYLVDHLGRRGSTLTVCCMLISVVHFTFAFWTPTTSAEDIVKSNWIPIVPLIILGLAYSFYGVAFWSSIACLFTKESVAVEEELPITPSDEVRVPHGNTITFGSEASLARQQLAKQLQSQDMSQSTINPQLQTLRSSQLNMKTLRKVSSTSLPLLAASRALSVKRKPYVYSDQEYTNADTLFKALDPDKRRRSSSQTPLISPQASEVEVVEDESNLALAYGISTSAMNLSLTIVPILAALLQQNSRPDVPVTTPNKGTVTTPEEFVIVESFFACEALFAALISAVIVFVDYRWFNGQKLEASHYTS